MIEPFRGGRLNGDLLHRLVSEIESAIVGPVAREE